MRRYNNIQRVCHDSSRLNFITIVSYTQQKNVKEEEEKNKIKLEEFLITNFLSSSCRYTHHFVSQSQIF